MSLRFFVRAVVKRETPDAEVQTIMVNGSELGQKLLRPRLAADASLDGIVLNPADPHEVKAAAAVAAQAAAKGHAVRASACWNSLNSIIYCDMGYSSAAPHRAGCSVCTSSCSRRSIDWCRSCWPRRAVVDAMKTDCAC